jgi:putative ABC transport system permease protein
VEHVLREEAPTTTTGRRRLLGALVVAQIAVAFLLLVSASLLILSFVRLMSVNPGFEAPGVIAARIRLSRWSYPSSQQQQQFFDQVLANLRARRAVRSVTLTTTLPFSEEWDVEWFSPGNLRPQSPLMGAIRFIVAPGFFETLGIPLRNGRTFDENDAARLPRVAIVGEALARSLWPNGDAVGRVLPLGGSGGPATIVAVVNDLKEWSLEEAEPMPQVYFPVSRAWTTPQMWLLARGGDRPLALAAAIRDAVRQADPQVPVGEIVPLEQLIGQRTAARRFSTTLMSLFAACAVVLALVGIYGLTAFAVNARAHELGIRVALGASPARVVRLLLAESVLRLGMGLGIGLLLSLWATRLLSAMLFGIEPADVATYAGAALAFSAVAIAATLLPAFRATRIDPMAVLRS